MHLLITNEFINHRLHIAITNNRIFLFTMHNIGIRFKYYPNNHHEIFQLQIAPLILLNFLYILFLLISIENYEISSQFHKFS